MERRDADPGRTAAVVSPAGATSYRLLIVDDEDVLRRTVGRQLRRSGYEVDEAGGAEAALARLAEASYELVIIDVQMPGRSGLWLLGHVRERYPEVATILLTAVRNVEVSVHAMREGAFDYLTKPVSRADLTFAVQRAIERRRLEIDNRRYKHHLEELVAQRTRQLEQAQEEILQRLALASEYRDDDTAAHCRRIGLLARLLGERVRPGADFGEKLEFAAPLHDVGKIGIPDRILRKPGALTPEERRQMQKHCDIGARILVDSRTDVLVLACTIASTHHERWDGGGYPRGLAGEAIPVEGRIVALADVFDALVSRRCYKHALSVDRSFRIIEEETGKHFDPALGRLFLELRPEVESVVDRFPTGTSVVEAA